MEEFAGTLFGAERLAKQVDELAGVIREAVGEESRSKLAALERAVTWRPVRAGRLRGFLPTMGQDVKPIKGFAEVRNQSVMDQLAGKS